MSESGSSRDATSLSILGTFFVILGLLVLVATAWTWGNKAATIVNLASGAVLAAVGGGMLMVARRLTSPDSGTTTEETPSADGDR